MLVNAVLLMQLFFVYDVGEQALATYQNILKCLVKIAGIPRISYITCLAQPMRLLIVRKRQHLINLPSLRPHFEVISQNTFSRSGSGRR